MASGRLLQLSAAVIDICYRIAALPAPGDEALATASWLTAGGGFNAMYAARQTGMAVDYGGAHGSGVYADLLRRALADNGIATLLPATPERDQGSCVVLIDDRAERTFISSAGAESRCDARQLATIDAAGYDFVLLSGYTLCYPGSRDSLRRWLARLPPPAKLVFDPAPVVDRITPPILSAVLRRCHWLSCNRREARALSGHADPATAAQHLLARRCPRAAGVIVRCGRQGCVLACRGQASVNMAGFAVAAVDSNGAGDAHIGTFLAALAAGAAPPDAARVANAAAALATTRFGPATAPSRPELELFLQENTRCKPTSLPWQG